MKKKRWLIWSSIIIVLLIIVNLIISQTLFNMVIKRGPKDFLDGNEDLEVAEEVLDVFLQGDWRDWVRSQDFETMNMTSSDGLSLQGYYLTAKEPTNKTVIFAHGYLGHGFDMGLFGEYYFEELGYNMFTPDLRAHGQSEGDYIGFGWLDRLDLIDWIDLIIDKNGPDSEIILHGLSMGAATVLMTSGEDLPENVKGIIADSPYSSVYDLFAYQAKRMYHLPDFPIIPTVSMISKWRANYSLIEASALEQVKKTTVPILYITGEADTFVPSEMTEKLFTETNSEAELITYPHANHGEAIVLYKYDYLEQIRSFIERYMYQ